MKKLFVFVFSIFLIFEMDSVVAITKEEFINEIKDGYIINDSLFKLSEEDFNKVEGYLIDNDISEENFDFLMRKIDEIVLIIEKGDSTSLYNLSDEEISSINSIIEEMLEKTGIKLQDKTSLSTPNNEKLSGSSSVIIAFVLFIVVAGIIVLLKTGD